MEIIIEIVVHILCISVGVLTGYILANILWHYIEKFLNKHWETGGEE